ncbi:conserved unknown protein [Ectocarpus siliculosus]|uniref:Rab-GAP TBC domain-containing protein n=1 Tax=Ectocarpus siliculosus TaxID=2880 RepID=D8LJB4_ECTSI|nr:conserved unknown protein [Ectocarpus siliculosus]|eukprot:CBN76998.1 conserved unknown protein [Ectocarpus siliculosus]
MRRLLLKDDRFLRDTFLPFLNIEDFGTLSGVCRRLKRSTYDLDVIVRCVESGGVTDATRGLMWLIMVGMDTVEPSSRGVLGVVIRERAESPEEQYDRLHRAMNGTVSIASPVKLTGTPAGRDGDNGGGEAQTAPAGPGADSGKEGDSQQQQQQLKPAGVGGRQGLLLSSDDESDANNMTSRSRGNSDSSAGCVAGDGGRLSDEGSGGGGGGGGGGSSSVTDAGGCASVGGESVLLWEDSGHGKGGAPSTTSPRLQLEPVIASRPPTADEQTTAPPPAAATSGVVGWASGLFRRTSGTGSPRTGGDSSPGATRASSLGSQESGPNLTNGASEAQTSAMSRMSSKSRLFGGLRYSRASTPVSTLPADNPSPSAEPSESFFGKNSGKEEEDTPPGDDAAGAVVNSEGDQKNGKENEGEALIERVPGLYSALLMSADAMDANDMTGVRGPKQSCFVDIEKDLQRTLGMTDVSPLRNVLRCTSTFVPDVGYVQGMNFVCRSVLQVFQDEEEAFWVFVGMLQRFRLRELYCPGMPLLRLRFFQLNRLLMWHLPELYDHFEACGVQTNLYATSWFVTLLSDGGMLPDSEVKVVWDHIFLHSSSPASQWAPMFLFLLELLRRASPALKEESRFSELIQRLVNMPFRELCRGSGACSTIEEGRRRFETSSPMPVQLLLLNDQWTEGGGEDGELSPKHDGDKQLL